MASNCSDEAEILTHTEKIVLPENHYVPQMICAVTVHNYDTSEELISEPPLHPKILKMKGGPH